MLTLCVIGAGRHCQLFHLPALVAYQKRHPHTDLAAICDLDEARARDAAREFGFKQSYNSADVMLEEIKPDACLMITPLVFTSKLALRLLESGCSVLVEKPLGSTIEGARAFVAATRSLETKAMVSMNRRFDPMTRAALEWVGPRPLTHIKAMMRRQNRSEPEFLQETGIHVVDAVRAIGGTVVHASVQSHEQVQGRAWTVFMRFANGVEAQVDIQPMVDRTEEYIQLHGSGFLAEAYSTEFDRGCWRGWSHGNQVASGDTRGLPPFFGNGTYAETEDFLEAVRHRRMLSPQPFEVLPSMEICHASGKLSV